MLFRVIWSAFAYQQLDAIFEYYHINISSITANKIVRNILLEIKLLELSPFVGQKEELLVERKTEYRYLIYSNYKIIYSVDKTNNCVKVADIFDTRQAPKKILN